MFSFFQLLWISYWKYIFIYYRKQCDTVSHSESIIVFVLSWRKGMYLSPKWISIMSSTENYAAPLPSKIILSSLLWNNAQVLYRFLAFLPPCTKEDKKTTLFWGIIQNLDHLIMIFSTQNLSIWYNSNSCLCEGKKEWVLGILFKFLF